MPWNLRDKNGKFRSRKSFKLDCAKDSQEPWEKRRQRLDMKAEPLDTPKDEKKFLNKLLDKKKKKTML